MTTEAVQRVMSGATWSDFCDALKAAGATVMRDDAPAAELDRAEGFRYLTRLTRIALDMMLECADPDFPVFYKASHETAKIGADNPDNIYLNATVTGDRNYRIRGTRGTVPYLSFGSKANRYAIDGTMATTGEIEADRLIVEPDGSFEVIASKTPHNGNWLPLADDTSFIIVRQTFLDRASEVPARLAIERIDGPATPRPLDAARLDGALRSAAAFVDGTARTFHNWSLMFRQRPNELPAQDQAMYNRAGGDPLIHYLHGYWQLEPGEALLIETEVPDCPIWNFQLDNWWMESLDYRYHQINVNKATARYEADGSVRIVVADTNPGYGNWIDTAGHRQGTMLLRWTGASQHPVPRCRVIRLDEKAA